MIDDENSIRNYTENNVAYIQTCPDINMQIVSVNGMTSFKIPMCTTYIYIPCIGTN